MPNDPSSHPMFEQLDPDTLKADIKKLIGRYQQSRSSLLAWIIVRYAEALLQHPDYHDNPDERCIYQRFSRQWRWFAQQAPRFQPTPIRMIES